MTNQASEDIRSKIKTAQFDLARRRATHIQVARRSGWTPSELDGVHEGDQIIFENDILTLIRTEKLKLLAAVRERVVGEDHLLFGHGEDWAGAKPQNSLKQEQREALNKLEAEL